MARDVTKTNLKLESHQIVLRPLVTEKVVRVNVQNRKGKPRRTRFRWGHTKDWKKAIVTLDPEHRIDFF